MDLIVTDPAFTAAALFVCTILGGIMGFMIRGWYEEERRYRSRDLASSSPPKGKGKTRGRKSGVGDRQNAGSDRESNGGETILGGSNGGGESAGGGAGGGAPGGAGGGVGAGAVRTRSAARPLFARPVMGEGDFSGRSEEPDGPAARDRARARPLVLLVDDRLEILALHSSYLHQHGYTVLTAADGDTALEYARAHHPAVIILDHSMPRRTGIEVARELKREAATRDIPILMMTAHSYGAVGMAAKQAGCDRFLSKPVEPSRMLREVEALTSPMGR